MPYSPQGGSQAGIALTGNPDYLLVGSDGQAWQKAVANKVSDGTNDEADMNTAATAVGTGGEVLLVGTFNVQTASPTKFQCRMRGIGVKGTIINLSASKVLSIGKDGNILDLCVNQLTGHADAGIDVIGETGFIDRQDLLRGVKVLHANLGAPPAGSRGIRLYGTNGGYIDTCTFHNFTVRGQEIPFEIITPTGTGYVQGNKIVGCNFRQGKLACVQLKRTDNGGVDGNIFAACSIEAYAAVTEHGFIFDMASYNVVDPFYLSDWSGVATKQVFNFKNSAYYNGSVGCFYRANYDTILVKDDNSTKGRNTVWDLSHGWKLAPTMRVGLQTGRADQWTISGTTWLAQTFTTTTRHWVKMVRLYGMRNGADTPGTVTVSLKAVDASHHPTGAALATATINGNLLQNDNWRWIDFMFNLAVELATGTEYVLEVKSAATGFLLGSSGATNPYTGGLLTRSTDSGSSWSEAATANEDALFEVWDLAGKDF